MTGNGGAFSSCSSTTIAHPAIVQQRRYSLTQHTARIVPSTASLDQRRSRSALAYQCGVRNHSFPHIARRSYATLQSLLLALCLSVFFCCRAVEADDVLVARYLEHQLTDLLFDQSTPPVPPILLLVPNDTPPDKPSSTRHYIRDVYDTSSARLALDTVTSGPDKSLPRPFDSSLGQNFTSPSCPAFFHNFLHNDEFVDCLPFSLLLQTSNSFFIATRSLPRLTQTLSATCHVDFAQCSALMASLAQDIQSDANCGQDLAMRNPIVQQAYDGFVAYVPLYHAGCLQDSQGEYCFAAAVTNASAPTSSYVYYLPLGVQLPAGTVPACTACLHRTMAIFSTYAANSTQPLSLDYASAAQQADDYCGPNFVSAAVQTSSSAASSPARTGAMGPAFALSLFVFVWALLV